MALFQGKDCLILHTRDKWEIPNDLRPERPKVSLDAAVEIMRQRFPNNRFRSISNTYNCVGMVMCSRRVWAYPEDLAKILKDDGYEKLSGPEQTDYGDVVIYRDEDGEPTHVGIVIKKNLLVDGAEDPLTILSKWGGDGEYIHESRQVPPEYGQLVECWTDRRRP
ncbi:MAG: hypothetical protein U0793_14765 [Gemmataceae bacterium]